jgi:hypothetical protein
MGSSKIFISSLDQSTTVAALSKIQSHSVDFVETLLLSVKFIFSKHVSVLIFQDLKFGNSGIMANA